MANDFVLSSGNAHEIEMSMNRVGNWSPDLVHKLCKGDFLGKVRRVLEGTAEIVIKGADEAVVRVKNILSVIKSVAIEATAEKKTADCFADKSRYYRDSSVIASLPEIQEVQPEGKAVANKLTEQSRFVGMVQSLLGTLEDAVTALSRLVIERKQIFTLTQIEALVERQESGEDVGLLTNGYGNFFLVLNKKGSVSVVSVNRVGRRWDVYVYPVDDADVWLAEDCFFSRN